MHALDSGAVIPILAGSHWGVSEPFYDFLQGMSFGQDGEGEMVYGYAQAVRLLVRFRYTVPEAGRLRFEFLDTADERHVHMFSPDGENQHRDTRFTLDEGEHARIFQGMSGPFTRMYRYALRFDREPFPEDYQPEQSILTYYGWPLDAP